MATGDLIRDDDGRVAWDRTWATFCGLAAAGGPPHRGTLLPFPDEPRPLSAGEPVRTELERGLALITGWPARGGRPGKVGLRCPDAGTAAWFARVIRAENVATDHDGRDAVVWLPMEAAFTVEHEIRNVITAVAKAYDAWLRERASVRTLAIGSANAK